MIKTWHEVITPKSSEPILLAKKVGHRYFVTMYPRFFLLTGAVSTVAAVERRIAPLQREFEKFSFGLTVLKTEKSATLHDAFSTPTAMLRQDAELQLRLNSIEFQIMRRAGFLSWTGALGSAGSTGFSIGKLATSPDQTLTPRRTNNGSSELTVPVSMRSLVDSKALAER